MAKENQRFHEITIKPKETSTVCATGIDVYLDDFEIKGVKEIYPIDFADIDDNGICDITLCIRAKLNLTRSE